MRLKLALVAAFCLAFPLSASANLRTVNICQLPVHAQLRTVNICQTGPPLTQQVCLCEIRCGRPVIWYFPVPHVMCFPGP
jgi:hypothetical protein